ncbi:MAG: stringent starvation protein A [Gammaproteobacteria bacterium]|nr:stringent starvation protein A [Gammaproteobacteria bacterium]
MALIANRKSVMTLFSGLTDIYSHRVRIVLAEKGINVEYHYVDSDNKPEDLIDLNPYNSVPTLVDRELVLFDSQVIMEYLDERFPHPPLMPVDPVSRARSRQMLYRIQRDWYGHVDTLSGQDESGKPEARVALRDALSTVAPIFEQKEYFMSDEFSVIDCAIAPILWRLSSFDIQLPPQAKAVYNYSERLFERETFVSSLSEAEQELR